MTEGQLLAVEQLKSVEAVHPDRIELLAMSEPGSAGVVTVEATLGCSDVPRESGGLPLRDRERFLISIPTDFPFTLPSANTPHTRFAGFPHVQWGRHLCLYRAPDSEWDAKDGMFGFLERLYEFLRDGAVGQLDATDAPLHPPVAYESSGKLVVPREDTPTFGDGNWFGTAHLRTVSDWRVDLVGWSELGDEETPRNVAAAILLSEPLTFFEFPSDVAGLLSALEQHGVPRRLLVLVLQSAILRNEKGEPLYVVIGAPMRGVRGSGDLKQHLSVWYVAPSIAGLLRIGLRKFSEHEELRELGEQAEAFVWEWATEAEVGWCAVREDRAEVTVRRDYDAPIASFRDRTIAIWGCGALGGHIAELLARAGVGRLILRDHAIVTPGILARQPFDDSDIGESKARALAERLRRIRPTGLEIQTYTRSVLRDPLDGQWAEADVIFDATASQRVLQKLERRWNQSTAPKPTVASVVVGHRAENGFVVIANAAHSGGPADVSRLAKLAVARDRNLRCFREEFWPAAGEREERTFQPEPGCSEPTFVGSAADLAGLSATMLNLIAEAIEEKDARQTARAYLVSRPQLRPRDSNHPFFVAFEWAPDTRVLKDKLRDYDVRVSDVAWRSIERWIRRSRRIRGPLVETGGLLFGERDDAARVVWVSDVSGPPPDSQASRSGFVCGTVGTHAQNRRKQRASGGSIQFVGMWHTHPEDPAEPSDTDHQGMRNLLRDLGNPTPLPLLLIIGYAASRPVPGAFLFGSEQPADEGTGQDVSRLGVLATLRAGIYMLASWPRGERADSDRPWYRIMTSFFGRVLRGHRKDL